MKSFSLRASKILDNFNDADLVRANLQMKLSVELVFFPRIIVFIRGTQLLQYTETIKRHSLASINGQRLARLWEQFSLHVSLMHSYGYIHGDILLKNIIFDGSRFRLIDHELRLYGRKELRATYPWIHPEDFAAKTISIRTDEICEKATFLRLFNLKKYSDFKSEQMARLNTLGVNLYQGIYPT